MSEHWGPPPPPPADPWGRAPQPAGDPNRTVLATSGGLPDGRGWPPPAGDQRWSPEPPPGIVPTVVVTAILGVFGLIPTSMAATRAQNLGLPTGRYWRAFGLTLAIVFVVHLLLVFLVVLPALRGPDRSATQPRPATTGYDDTGAPTSEPPQAQPDPRTAPAPMTDAPQPGAPQPDAPQPGAPVTRAPVTQAPVPTQAPAEDGRTVRVLPPSWITVLDSMPKTQRTEQEAWAMADGLSRSGARVVVVDSDRISGLNGGYWAIAITGSSSRNEAGGWCAVMDRPVGGTCYPRQVG